MAEELRSGWLIVPQFIDIPCPRCGGDTRMSVELVDEDGTILDYGCRKCRPEIVEKTWRG